MSIKVSDRTADNTRFIELIDPRGNRCPIPISPRHGTHEAVIIDYYRRKGFRTLADVEREAELERLQRENEELRAKTEAAQEAQAPKDDKPKTGGKAK